MSDQPEKKTSGASCGCGQGSCCSGPSRWIWLVLLVAIAGVLIAKAAARKQPAAADAASQEQALPRLVDLGAGECIPCKAMAPILEELKNTYAGKLDVEFIDVWADVDAGKKYGINMIPTQIFYDATGTERFRHEGFFGKEDILAKWKEFGVDLQADAPVTPPSQ